MATSMKRRWLLTKRLTHSQPTWMWRPTPAVRAVCCSATLTPWQVREVKNQKRKIIIFSNVQNDDLTVSPSGFSPLHSAPPLLVCDCFCRVFIKLSHVSSFAPPPVPLLLLFMLLFFLGSECASPTHSAPPTYHYHYPLNPPSSPALLVHTECPRDCPLDDTMHQSVLHMPRHLGTAP